MPQTLEPYASHQEVPLELDPSQVRLGPQGRVVIPAPFREELGLKAGETLIVRLEDGRLILERPKNVLRRLRDRFKVIPPEVKLSEELLRDRRAEAEREP